MVDLLVTLWDGRQGTMRKVTKMSGNDEIVNPWINIVACTTPAWIAGNFPEYLIGGGFTSRCIFVYADTKEQYVPYPRERVPRGMRDRAMELIHDLEYISVNLCGEYMLSAGAVSWGTAWYQHHYENRPDGLDDQRFGGYIARKQTHIHKLAMILAASQRDNLVITEEDLVLANTMVTDLETDMPKVFARLGQDSSSAHMERFVAMIRRRGKVPYADAYRFACTYFPDSRNFESMLAVVIRANMVRLVTMGQNSWFEPVDTQPNITGDNRS